MHTRVEIKYQHGTFITYDCNNTVAVDELQRDFNRFYDGCISVESVQRFSASDEEYYSHRAILFAEKYGVIEYKVTGNRMVFYSSYPMERATVKATVNLDNMKEARTHMKYYYKSYSSKIGKSGLTANYCL